MMDRWESTPRLAFLSPEPGSGKSRALEATEPLVPRPVNTVNVSPAYLFRKVASDEGSPTVLFDEIDTVFGPKAKDNEEVRGWLNAGHRRGAMAGRCVVRGKTVETEELPAYCAVAVAGLGWLPDTIMTRSIVIRMRRRHGGETVEPFRLRLVAKDAEQLRDSLAAWAAAQPKEINWPELPDCIQDRDADVWEALIAIADLAGGDWPERVRQAAVTLVTSAKESEPSLGVRLLSDLRNIFGESEQLATVTILEKLVALDESIWADLKGKSLDSRGLAVRLKQYGVNSKVLRFGPKLARGYSAADLHEPWLRYVPSQAAESVTSLTDATPRHVTAFTDVTQLRGDGR
jgi:hypothetical protein